MLSYQNDPALKSRFCAHIERHRIEDRILQGLYGGLVEGEWKGCAVGCALRSLDEIDGKTRTEYQDHGALASRLDIPIWLARLQDSVFEGLSQEDSKHWPTRLANAMPVGRDLEQVWPKFAYWLLADPVAGVIRFAGNAPSKKAISDVAKLYQRWIAGDKPSETEWYRASAYAAAAASAAASAAADAAATAAATAAAYNATAATTYAASAANATEKHWKLISDKLCELIAAA